MIVGACQPIFGHRLAGITKKTTFNSTNYWAKRASSAARDEGEKGIALQYQDQEALAKRSGSLLEVLGVEPQDLVEIIR